MNTNISLLKFRIRNLIVKFENLPIINKFRDGLFFTCYCFECNKKIWLVYYFMINNSGFSHCRKCYKQKKGVKKLYEK